MSPEKLVALVMLVALTFGSGLQVNREHLMAVLRNIGLTGRVLLANLVIVPILGVLLAKLFALPPEIETGFLLMAIAPGVPFVLINVRKRGGSLGMAVELEVLLPLLSVITVPLTAQFVLPTAAASQLPILKFVITLVLFQLLPLLVGIIIAGRLPATAPKLGRMAHLLFLLSALALFILLGPKLASGVASVYGSHGIWAMLCLVILSMISGWALGGPPREDRRVVGIGTTLRNIGLCALIATTSFPGTDVAPTVLTYFIVQFIFVMIVGVYFTRTAARETTAKVT
jgi:bile acid:Na+ symporter, BASS family